MEILSEVTILIRYTCKSMGLNCSFLVDGKDMEDVLNQALVHVREKHANNFNTIESLEEVERMKKALANSTRVIAD